IAGAGIDVTDPEPLPESSPLWELENVVLTPHTGGETQRYEDNVIDALIDNLDRLAAGRSDLRNQIV
ncbi:MAG: NAD(P)-dependent oxidoreductase, partial [Alphaproteobacteria bacterium]